MHLQTRGEMFYAVGYIAGRLHRASTGIRADGREAREAARVRMLAIEQEIRDGLKKGAAGRATYPTFAGWWEEYRETYGGLTVRGGPKAASTQRREVTLIHPALVLFGKRPLNGLRESDRAKYLTQRRAAMSRQRGQPQPVSHSTIAREMALLTTVWNRARTDYPGLPAIFKTLPYTIPVRDRVVSLAEQEEFLRRLTARYHRLALFLLGTGTRISEALGVDPMDIDWAQRLVTVTGKGNKTRRVPLLPGVANLLRAQLAETGTLWQTWKAATVTAAFARACAARRRPQRDAMEPITPHTLRHTFGSRWLTGGGSGDPSKRGDIHVLSKVLGHASVAITEKHYVHLRDHDLRDAMQHVDVGVSQESVQPWV
jgi:integrase